VQFTSIGLYLYENFYKYVEEWAEQEAEGVRKNLYILISL